MIHGLWISISATSMLVTDVGDGMCWRKFWDVGDGFGCFCHQHPLSTWDVVNIEILSLTSKYCHQDKVTNIYVAINIIFILTLVKRKHFIDAPFNFQCWISILNQFRWFHFLKVLKDYVTRFILHAIAQKQTCVCKYDMLRHELWRKNMILSAGANQNFQSFKKFLDLKLVRLSRINSISKFCILEIKLQMSQHVLLTSIRKLTFVLSSFLNSMKSPKWSYSSYPSSS